MFFIVDLSNLQISAIIKEASEGISESLCIYLLSYLIAVTYACTKGLLSCEAARWHVNGEM